MYQIPTLLGGEILVYLRKSRADDALLTVEEVLAKHEQMLREWMVRNLPEGTTVPEENYYREVVSGETIESRPCMKALLRRIESQDIKAVLTVEPQRLSRGDFEDIGRLVKLFRYTNTIVLTLRYSYDLADDRDRDDFERELKRGNEFLEYQKRIMNNGRLLAVENGAYIGNFAPYGYRKTSIKEGKRAIYTLDIIPEQAEVVRRIFQMYSQGMGCTKICDALNAEHIPTRRGGKWEACTLHSMLDNDHYIGKVRWYWRKTVISVEEGEVKAKRPRSKDYPVFEGRHPAIIDQELWDAVKKIRGKHPRNKNAHNLTNPLATLMYCANCGTAISGRKYNKNGVERCVPRYLCTNRCGMASAKMSEVLDAVAKILDDKIEDFKIKIEKANDVDERIEAHKQKIARLEHRLEELQKAELQQWEEKIKHGMPEHVFKALNSRTLEDIDGVSQALEEAKNSCPEPLDIKEKLVTFKAAVDALRSPDASVKEKNRLLRACIERIEFSRERVGIKGHPKKGEAAPFHLEVTLKL